MYVDCRQRKLFSSLFCSFSLVLAFSSHYLPYFSNVRHLVPLSRLSIICIACLKCVLFFISHSSHIHILNNNITFFRFSLFSLFPLGRSWSIYIIYFKTTAQTYGSWQQRKLFNGSPIQSHWNNSTIMSHGRAKNANPTYKHRATYRTNVR